MKSTRLARARSHSMSVKVWPMRRSTTARARFSSSSRFWGADAGHEVNPVCCSLEESFIDCLAVAACTLDAPRENLSFREITLTTGAHDLMAEAHRRTLGRAQSSRLPLVRAYPKKRFSSRTVKRDMM
jgi:hypothetical protein